MFKYKLSERISTHSFGNYQVSVVTILDKDKKVHKGIGIDPAPRLIANTTNRPTSFNDEELLVVDEPQSKLLSNFIEDVVNGSIPRKIEVETSGPTLAIDLKKFTDKWHGGGGYKGTISFDTFFTPVLSKRTTISKESLMNFRSSLDSLYESED